MEFEHHQDLIHLNVFNPRGFTWGVPMHSSIPPTQPASPATNRLGEPVSVPAWQLLLFLWSKGSDIGATDNIATRQSCCFTNYPSWSIINLSVFNDYEKFAEQTSPTPWGQSNDRTLQVHHLRPHLWGHLPEANSTWSTPCGLGRVRHSKLDYWASFSSEGVTPLFFISWICMRNMQFKLLVPVREEHRTRRPWTFFFHQGTVTCHMPDGPYHQSHVPSGAEWPLPRNEVPLAQQWEESTWFHVLLKQTYTPCE